jgi:hypothetical protein
MLIAGIQANSHTRYVERAVALAGEKIDFQDVVLSQLSQIISALDVKFDSLYNNMGHLMTTLSGDMLLRLESSVVIDSLIDATRRADEALRAAASPAEAAVSLQTMKDMIDESITAAVQSTAADNRDQLTTMQGSSHILYSKTSHLSTSEMCSFCAMAVVLDDTHR